MHYNKKRLFLDIWVVLYNLWFYVLPNDEYFLVTNSECETVVNKMKNLGNINECGGLRWIFTAEVMIYTGNLIQNDCYIYTRSGQSLI